MNHIDTYLRYAEAYKGIKPERLTRCRRVLLELEATAGGRLDDCEAHDLTEFLVAKLEGGKNPNTVRQYRGMALAFFRWLWRDAEAITAESYMRLREVGPPTGSTGNMQPNPYSRTELAEFWRVLYKRYPVATLSTRWPRVWRHYFLIQMEAVVALALEMGLRRNEIWSLGLDDLHYDNAYVVVNGKGDKVREVPFTEHARERVQDWMESRVGLKLVHDRPWVNFYQWEDGSRGPMSLHAFGGLPGRVMHYHPGHWTLHRFRHTCATERLRAGMSLESLSAMLGHASLQQTLAYAKLVRRDVANQMAGSQAAFDGAVRPRRLAAAAPSSRGST